ncbi:MAG: penicillin-binding protein [Bacteroidales bacterium]|jgi:penicillin-binding protein 1A|nr:penicillin-binding protein [Bacteroidales bacterium]MDN5329409.1 penicillin-binding protein [Bacteroidales bacterium]
MDKTKNRVYQFFFNFERYPSDIKDYIRKIWLIFSGLLAAIFLFFLLLATGLFGDMPTFEDLENPKSNLATQIISADGKVLGTYYVQNRYNAHFSDLSKHLVYALIATEDARFMKHPGIDFKATFRVMFGVLTGRHAGGGSTITQQLAKNLFPRGENLSKPAFILRKFKEWVTAIKLERNYTKEEIIAMYFNTVDFGSNAFGIKSAANTFFGKEPSELNAEEAATLVAIVNAPTRYSPVRNPENSLRRRNLVIKKMASYFPNNYEAMEDSLKNLPLDMSHYRVMDHKSGLATYFREILRGQLTEWCSKHYKSDGTPYNLYKDGLKIYTTINSRMQEYAEYAVKKHLAGELQPAFFRHWKGYKNAPFSPDLSNEDIQKIMDDAMRRSDRYIRMRQAGISKDSIRLAFNTKTRMKVFSWRGEIDTLMTPMDSIRYSLHFLQAGLMSVESNTGFVRAYVGGIDYRYFQFDHVIMSKRQVGSTFKPFLYTLAMQEGEFGPCTQVPNVPVSFEMDDGTIWTPKNSDDAREGQMVTLKWALANSVNYISAFLMKRYSPQAVITIARKMGITSNIPAVPSICLGTPEISLYEMTGAFNTFANRGVWVEPILITRIEDKNGNLLEAFVPRRQDAISEETAYLMTELLKGVVQSGTGIRLRYKYGFDNPIAGKTGTTQNQSDGWFIGITPQLTTGIWVGGELRSIRFRSITLGQGASMALPIWAYFMQKVYADPTLGIRKDDFPRPAAPLRVDLNCTGQDDETEQYIEEEF